MSDEISLDWSSRQLTELPASFGQRTALQKLDLSRASAFAW